MPRLAITARRARLARLAAIAALVASPIAATPLTAQTSGTTSDTAGALPFRRGQWGTQFGFDGNIASAGALRFRSERSAWLVNLEGYARRFTYEPVSPPDDAGERDASNYSLGLQLGMRRYRAIATRANAFTGVGLVGQMRMDRLPFGDGLVLASRRTMAGGIYGELGATWMATRNFGLSASTGLSATYDREQVEQSPSPFTPAVESDARGYGVTLDRARLMVVVFF